MRRLAHTLNVSVPVIKHIPFPPRMLLACKYMGSGTLALYVGIYDTVSVYKEDSVMSELATRYVVVETKRRRIIELRMAFMEERVYLCLGHIKIM